MLEITILKTIHEGADEASKLIPFIEQADVFSIESPTATHETAGVQEAFWEEIYTNNIQFLELADVLPFVNVIPDGGYMHTAFKWLYIEQVPLWNLERWSRQGAVKTEQLHERANSCFMAGTRAALQGNIERAVECMYTGTQFSAAYLQRRDRHIARSLERAEQAIRARYPYFGGMDPVELFVQIGAAHTPERYTSLPIKVISLEDEKSDAINSLCNTAEQQHMNGSPRTAVLESLRNTAQRIYEEHSAALSKH